MFFSKLTGGFYTTDIHGENIPADSVEITNEEYAALLNGQSVGKFIDVDADGKPYLADPPPLTTAQIVSQYESALDAHLDSVAQADRWRDRFTFAVRAGYENPWQTKAKTFGTWMDACNVQAYALLAAVTAGTAELPTVEDFIAAMPPAPVLQ